MNIFWEWMAPPRTPILGRILFYIYSARYGASPESIARALHCKTCYKGAFQEMLKEKEGIKEPTPICDYCRKNEADWDTTNKERKKVVVCSDCYFGNKDEFVIKLNNHRLDATEAE